MVNLHPVDKTKLALMKLGFDNKSIDHMIEGKTVVIVLVDREENEIEASCCLVGIGNIGYSLQISIGENIKYAIPYTVINTFKFEDNSIIEWS